MTGTGRWTKSHIAGLLARWIPAVLLATIFIPQGLAKFDDASGWARAFNHWGYAPWFRYLIGTFELGGVLLLLWGRTAVYGAMLLLTVMLGAVGTHAVFPPFSHARSEVVPIVLATLVLVLRRDQLRRHHGAEPAGPFSNPPRGGSVLG